MGKSHELCMATHTRPASLCSLSSCSLAQVRTTFASTHPRIRASTFSPTPYILCFIFLEKQTSAKDCAFAEVLVCAKYHAIMKLEIKNGNLIFKRELGAVVDF